VISDCLVSPSRRPAEDVTSELAEHILPLFPAG
jgi:hypothetical protein